VEDTIAAEVLGEIGRDHRIEGLIGTDGERVLELVEVGRSIPAGVRDGIALVDAEPVRLGSAGVHVAAGPHEHGQPPVMEGAPDGTPTGVAPTSSTPPGPVLATPSARDRASGQAIDERGGDDYDEGDRDQVLGALRRPRPE
jgi:hypothetical protein